MTPSDKGRCDCFEFYRYGNCEHMFRPSADTTTDARGEIKYDEKDLTHEELPPTTTDARGGYEKHPEMMKLFILATPRATQNL